MRKIISIFIILIIFSNCNYERQIKIPKGKGFWYLQDYEQDKVLGLSLKKALKFIKGKKNEKVIVAVIDTDIDIEHPVLKKYIWRNLKEKINKKDDDLNGYIDDINGWNFTRNQQGDKIIYGLNSNIAVLNSLNNRLGGDNSISNLDSISFNLYNEAKNSYSNDIKANEENLLYYSNVLSKIPRAKEIIRSVIGQNDFTLKDLDSLKKLTYGEEQLDSVQYYALLLWQLEKYYPNGKFERAAILEEKKSIYSLNSNYDDREIVGDDIDDLNFINYGSPVVNSNLDILKHGTRVTGVLAKFADISKLKLEIMCLSIQPQLGGFKEKDLYLAIKYAVDNGASIINLSSSIEFTLNQDVINDAIEYAELNNVMFITSAGNNGNNLDLKNSFPNGKMDGQIYSNFIKVGASSPVLESEGKLNWTNYGKNSVDFFAPGDSISTIDVGYVNDYIDSGTSLSSIITSGVVALLRSYYPDLNQKELKNILLSSVMIPPKNEIDSLESNLMLSEFTISGGILNAFNAVVMADSLNIN